MDSQSKAKRMNLQGPRPGPLMVDKSSRKTKKHVAGEKQYSSPVVVYVRSPKVFHVRPQEFMSLVQQLTGNSNPPSSTSSHLYSCDDKLYRPDQLEKNDSTINQISQLEHFKFTSRVGPADT